MALPSLPVPPATPTYKQNEERKKEHNFYRRVFAN